MGNSVLAVEGKVVILTLRVGLNPGDKTDVVHLADGGRSGASNSDGTRARVGADLVGADLASRTGGEAVTTGINRVIVGLASITQSSIAVSITGLASTGSSCTGGLVSTVVATRSAVSSVGHDVGLAAVGAVVFVAVSVVSDASALRVGARGVVSTIVAT